MPARPCELAWGRERCCQDGGMNTQGTRAKLTTARVFCCPSSADWTLEVARSAAADAGGVDLELLGDFLDRLAAHSPEHDWDRHTNAAFEALGARAAEQGVALRALVDLYLSAAWRAWPSCQQSP